MTVSTLTSTRHTARRGGPHWNRAWTWTLSPESEHRRRDTCPAPAPPRPPDSGVLSLRRPPRGCVQGAPASPARPSDPSGWLEARGPPCLSHSVNGMGPESSGNAGRRAWGATGQLRDLRSLGKASARGLEPLDLLSWTEPAPVGPVSSPTAAPIPPPQKAAETLARLCFSDVLGAGLGHRHGDPAPGCSAGQTQRPGRLPHPRPSCRRTVGRPLPDPTDTVHPSGRPVRRRVSGSP